MHLWVQPHFIFASDYDYNCFLFYSQTYVKSYNFMVQYLHLRFMFTGGGAGLSWDHIMENELECLPDRGGHGGHLAVTVSGFGCGY